MIVRPAGERVVLITQPDHAHLAREVMERCAPLAPRPRRESLLRAVGEHDAAWAEVDAEPRVDPESGGVLDFVRVPLATRQGVWPRSVALLADDPWAAALVAHHAVFVYDRFRAVPDWTAFFAAMERSRGERLAASGLALGDLLADYPFVRLGDLISLAFCTGSPDEQRVGEWTVRLAGDRVLVRPDPFGGAEVPVAIEARELGGGPFRSDEELRAAVRVAPVTTLSGAVAGE